MRRSTSRPSTRLSPVRRSKPTSQISSFSRSTARAWSCGVRAFATRLAKRPIPPNQNSSAEHRRARSATGSAWRPSPRSTRQWVVLVDGLPQQLKLIRREAKRRKVEITIVVDFFHVLEYLWKAARNFFEQGDAAAEAWVNERALEVLRGRAPHVAAGIRRSATTRNLQERAGADACANYLLKKKRFLSTVRPSLPDSRSPAASSRERAAT